MNAARALFFFLLGFWMFVKKGSFKLFTRQWIFCLLFKSCFFLFLEIWRRTDFWVYCVYRWFGPALPLIHIIEPDYTISTPYYNTKQNIFVRHKVYVYQICLYVHAFLETWSLISPLFPNRRIVFHLFYLHAHAPIVSWTDLWLRRNVSRTWQKFVSKWLSNFYSCFWLSMNKRI